MKVAFLGGGTGGHLAPGIGVAAELQRRGVETVFLVAGRDVEHAMLGPRGLPAVPLFSDTFASGPGAGRPSPVRLDRWWSARRRLSQALALHDPDVVVLTGGWVALPALLSRLGGRPTVLVEPNVVPGKVGRLLSRRVDHTCVVNASVVVNGRGGRSVTGAPTLPLGRWEAREAREHLGLDPDRRTLLVMGGSQGARDLAALVPGARDALAADGRPWQVLHVIGRGGTFDDSQPSDSVSVVQVPFVSEMGAAWAAADLALCRAGAGTVAELAASGTPAVLVPYPHHADHHQEANGRALVEAGAALMVPRNDPSGRSSAVSLLVRALGRLPAMAEAARGQATPQAATRVAELVERVARERGRVAVQPTDRVVSAEAAPAASAAAPSDRAAAC